MIIGMLVGNIPPPAGPFIGAFCGVTVIGFVTLGVIAFRRNDILTGTLDIVFGIVISGGAMWWAIGAAFVGPANMAAMGGWLFLVIAIIVFLFLPAFARVNALMFFNMVLLCICFGFASGWSWAGMPPPALPGGWLAVAGGWMLLAFAIIMLYFGWSVLTNTIYARTVVPMGPPLIRS